MDISKAINFISENNISPEDVFDLVEEVKQMDLSDEQNIRKVIRKVSKIAGKQIDKTQENKIVQEILKNGVNDDLFNYL